ncbi:unnamed protein product [Effrenium voratum]|nr:unnamed protein product [Effrenium voratum]
MKKQLEAEAEKDEEVDEKMKCWCKETMQSKEESIASTESQISSLGGSIETAAADSMRLALEVEGHESDLAKSQESLSMAEAQREKQQKTFQEEEKEMKESLTGVDAALDTLQKKSSFLSTSASAAKRAEALDLVKKLQTKHFNLLRAPHQRKLMLSMASAHLDVDANPATGEVVGIMSQMKDTFETNLNQTLKEEAESALTFNGLQEAKTAEIKATQEAILSKKAQHAKADTEGARAKQDLENAQASILVDKQFLADAKEKCAAHEAEFAERVKTRNEEITGCSKAVAILSDDSARDTFGRTFNAGFLQLSSESVPSAASVLARAAAKSQDARLASLAQLVRTSAFDQVKKEIDGLVVQLKEVQQDEVKSKDSCVQRLHENNMDTTKSTNDKAQAESKLSGLKDWHLPAPARGGVDGNPVDCAQALPE